MTNREFVIWMSGFFDLLGEEPQITKQQLYIINNHLNLAEAVEGGLGDFNLEIRAIIKPVLSALEPSDSSTIIPQHITGLLRTKTLTQIKSF